MRNNLFLIGGNGRLGLASLHPPAASRWSAPNMATGIGQAYESDPAGDRTKAHGKENPPTFYVVRLPSPTRAPSPRLLPTDHDYAVSTRGYQSDQPSHWPLVLSPARPFSSAQARLNLGLDTVAPYQKETSSPLGAWRVWGTRLTTADYSLSNAAATSSAAASSLCSKRSTRESFLPKFSLSISWDRQTTSAHQSISLEQALVSCPF